MLYYCRGEAFRHSLHRLGEVRSILPNGVHVMALTATATKSLQSEVAEILGMMNTISLAVSPCKANIMYAVGEYSNISETSHCCCD